MFSFGASQIIRKIIYTHIYTYFLLLFFVYSKELLVFKMEFYRIK
jgi:hypothetical protein